MGVNAAALIHYRLRSAEKVPLAATAPLLGLIISAFIWLNLNHSALLLGSLWIVLGLLLYYAMRRNSTDTAVTPGFE